MPIIIFERVSKPTKLANDSSGAENKATQKIAMEIKYQRNEYLAGIRFFRRMIVVITNKIIEKDTRVMMSSNDIFCIS